MPIHIHEENPIWTSLASTIGGITVASLASGHALIWNGIHWTNSEPATGSGSGVGGANTQVQFNDGGNFGGDNALTYNKTTDQLRLDGAFGLTPIAEPQAPLDGILTYSRNRANRNFLMTKDASGLETALQPALFGNNVSMWLPGTTTTAAINFGVSWTVRNGTGGAQSHPALTATNQITQMKRARYTSGPTINSSSGVQSSTTVAWRGDKVGLGGFFFFARFALEANPSLSQCMVGLSAHNGTINNNPSAINNTICMGFDSTDPVDGNWQLIFRDVGSFSKVSLVSALRNTTDVYDFMLFSSPNSATLSARVVNITKDMVILDNAYYNTSMPSLNTFLYAHAQMRITAGNTPSQLALNRIYIESRV